jgi:hypothetical protein
VEYLDQDVATLAVIVPTSLTLRMWNWGYTEESKKEILRKCRKIDVQNGFTTDQSVPSFRYSVPPADCFPSVVVADDIPLILTNISGKL